jgi:hypothetical protein
MNDRNYKLTIVDIPDIPFLPTNSFYNPSDLNGKEDNKRMQQTYGGGGKREREKEGEGEGEEKERERKRGRERGRERGRGRKERGRRRMI